MSALNWFEIPVMDIERATKFYSLVLSTEIPVTDLTEQMGSKLGMLPDYGGIGGALVENSQHGYSPSNTGTMVYLARKDEDLNACLARVEEAGGTILMPKTDMGALGFSAWIRDTEGNKIGLHSTK